MLWVVLLIIILVLVFGPAIWVKWVMRSYAEEIPGMPGTGGELAKHLVAEYQLEVEVEETEAGDHYDPLAKAVRLSPDNFNGKSLTAVAVAAHEVGHAIQDHRGDRHLAMRSALVPVADRIARISAGCMWAAPIVGILLRHPVPFSTMIVIGMAGLIARMLVHLVTLPTEFDASFGKALPILTRGKYIAPGEDVAVRKILRAAAMTYVSAALADILNLARWAALLLRR